MEARRHEIGRPRVGSGLTGPEKARSAGWVSWILAAGWIVLLVIALLWQVRPEPERQPPAGWRNWRGMGSVLALAVAEEGVYAGGSRGLFLLTESGLAEPVPFDGGAGTAMVRALLLDPEGALWVGHDRGLSVERKGVWKHFSQEDGMPDGAVRALALSRCGDVWLGSHGGAVRLPRCWPWNGGAITVLKTRDGLLHDAVNAIVEDRDGGVWLGNDAAPAGGLSRYKDEQWRYWTPREGLPHASVTSLMLDQDGQVWAGCGFLDRGGAAVFSGASGDWRLVATIPRTDLAGPKVRSLGQDVRGRIWLGSENDGIAVRLRDKTVRVLTVDSGLAAQEVMAIAEARDGSIWLGTLDGLTRIGPHALDALFPQ